MMPVKYGGLELGGLGFAYKILILQFIITNVQVWYISKYLDIRMLSLIRIQVVTLTILMITAGLSHYLISLFQYGLYIDFLIKGIIYSIFVLLLSLYVPLIFSINNIRHYLVNLI